MGHLDQGISRALGNQALKYGFLTRSGKTGGVRLDAADRVACSRTGPARATADQRIGKTRDRLRRRGDHKKEWMR